MSKKIISLFLLIGILLTGLIGIVGYQIMGGKKPEYSVPQSTIAPTIVLSPVAQPSESSVVTSPSLFFFKPTGTIHAHPGEIISIELKGNGIIEALLTGKDFAENKKNDGTNTFSFQYTVPANATGTITLSGLGKTDTGTFVQSDTLTINISLTNSGKIVSLRAAHIMPDNSVILFVGDSEQLDIFGIFSDGIERNITATSFGTKYTLYPGQPLNTEIISVDENGRVTAVNTGQRSVVITNSNYSGNAISINFVVQEAVQ